MDLAKMRAKQQKGPGWIRLPHGSCKTLTYDAEKVEWCGVMTVPYSGEPSLLGTPAFSADESVLKFWFAAKSERQCYHGLHALYVRWLEEREPLDAPATAG